ncbi:hypothetical protein EV13_1077 [Prochlorococcus sp. MIT 0702]|nr:hypothetical protein EV13_1077 [Prochlorococcus sp. MIT 0702]
MFSARRNNSDCGFIPLEMALLDQHALTKVASMWVTIWIPVKSPLRG